MDGMLPEPPEDAASLGGGIYAIRGGGEAASVVAETTTGGTVIFSRSLPHSEFDVNLHPSLPKAGSARFFSDLPVSEGLEL